MSIATRKEALERLAEEHDIKPGTDSTSAEDYAAVLQHPEQIGEWCAVTYSDETGLTYLYPEFATLEEAQERAGRYVSDPLYAERPEHVVNLDTGERQTAVVGITAWIKEAKS